MLKKVAILTATLIFVSLCLIKFNLHYIKSVFFNDIYSQKEYNNKAFYYKVINKTSRQMFYDKYTDFAVDVLQVLPVAIAVCARNPVMYVDYSASLLLALPVVAMGKKIIKIPRPDDKNDLTSFPSGHAMFAGISAFTILVHVRRNKRIFYIMNFFITMFSLSVPVGRVLANRHWATDVVFGYLTGVLLTYFTYAFAKVINKKLRIF